MVVFPTRQLRSLQKTEETGGTSIEAAVASVAKAKDRATGDLVQEEEGQKKEETGGTSIAAAVASVAKAKDRTTGDLVQEEEGKKKEEARNAAVVAADAEAEDDLVTEEEGQKKEEAENAAVPATDVKAKDTIGVPEGERDKAGRKQHWRHSSGVSERNTVIEVVNIVGCRVSNDPDGETPQLIFCNETAFVCDTDKKQVAYEIPFDYEVHYNPESSLLDNIIPYIEEVMLEQLSMEMGLNDCNAVRQGGDGDGRRHRYLGGFENEDLERFVGISLFPRDTVNEDIESCSMPIVVVDGEDDEEEIEVAASSNCRPVNGTLTIYTAVMDEELLTYGGLPPDDEVALRKAVLGEIKRGMDEDIYEAPGHISKVNFVETPQSNPQDKVTAASPNEQSGAKDTATANSPHVSRTKPTEGEQEAGVGGMLTNSKGDGESGVAEGVEMGLSIAIIGTIVGALVLLLLVVLTLCLIRRLRRNRVLKAHSIEQKPVLDGTEKSLATKDSLAIKPQGFGFPHPRTSARDVSATSASPSNVTHRQGSSDGSGSAEEIPPSLSRSITSYDAAQMYELEVIAEGASSGESLPTNYQFSYDCASGLQMDDSKTDDNEDEKPDHDSECRRVLQMS